jgi:hypothetical protein
MLNLVHYTNNKSIRVISLKSSTLESVLFFSNILPKAWLFNIFNRGNW